MGLLEIIVVFLGIALIVCLLYFAFTQQPMPPGLRTVVLIAVALMFVACLLHAAGCQIRPPGR